MMIVGAGRGKITVNVYLNLQSNMILLVHSMIFKYQSLMQLDVGASVKKKKKDIELIAVSEETYNWLFSIKNVSLLIRGVRKLR